MKIGKSLFAVLTALTLTLTTLSTLCALPNVVYAEENMAYLEYDPKSDTYSLVTESGKQLNAEFYEIAEETEATVQTEATSESAEITTAISESSTETTTTAVTTVPSSTDEIITGTVVFTTVTLKPLSPAQTVTQYTGRYRNDGNNQWDNYLNTYVTTTTTTTTKTVYDGIDVSRHQGLINWKKVKASGIDFVMIRAGYGMEYDQVDANFHFNIKEAQKQGIDCGVYWYSYALNEEEALREAKVCYDTIKDYKLTYPVSFDIEDPSQKSLTKTQISNITKTFCEYLESKNYYVSVYSYASMLNDKMNSSVLSSYDIWVAHTGVSKPSFSGKYGMWQYSWTGSVDGITGDVDLDYGYKNYPQVMISNKYNGN